MCVPLEEASEIPYSRVTGRLPLWGMDIRLWGFGLVCWEEVAMEGPKVLGREAVRPVPVPVGIDCLHRTAPSF